MELYHEYSNRADNIFHLVNIYSKYMSAIEPDDDSNVTIVERRVLININENHGITNVELASLLGRTPGAITQIIIKLQNKGLVERVKKKGNAKAVHLFPTLAGVNLALDYKAKEIIGVDKIVQSLNMQYSSEEIDTFWNVLSGFVATLSYYSINSKTTK